jgi:cell wall-associated NlpC family hydrolase
MNWESIEESMKELEGTPYVWWREGDRIHEEAPFWRSRGEIPSVERIKKEGTNCAGFVNLICRKHGVEIAGFGEIGFEETAGGTYGWFGYLDKHKKLDVFNETEKYPEGTLLLRAFYDEDDQGHVAIVCRDGKLAHSYSEKGVQIDERYMESHRWIPEGYYTHICRRENWFSQKKD